MVLAMVLWSNFNHSSKVQKRLYSNNQLGYMVEATASGSSNSYRFAKRVSNSKNCELLIAASTQLIVVI